MQQAVSWFLLVVGLVIAASDFPDAIWEPLTPRAIRVQPVTAAPDIATRSAIPPEKETLPKAQTIADTGREPTLPKPKIIGKQ